ncbi:class I SAM-dependent methyltransferase [Prescottella agglutinans]|uniref:DNA (Cytosine-5)-methyltransferase 1 n=1 Tax=Prescottella agglutinans TaxID=1644129 RepID=A0ABT6M4X3_9NOCA|nr:class I SAM-dependent methyltransferase [Prescottella agglutinans]MDH6279358.1 DNA (cytosine-5)-methyltransferase 1 [Prescottella agglutinans]
MRVLDLYCGAGGAGMGYALAGACEVVGVDNKRQRRYPFEFHQGDALEYLAAHGHEFDLIHASPPCQAHSKAQVIRSNEHPELVGPTRDLLLEIGKPYVIENVPGAPLLDPILMCGAMSGLRTYRHRLFEFGGGLELEAPPHPEHTAKVTKMGRAPVEGEFMHIVGNFIGVDEARKAMGIGWMSRRELAQAIPSVYTLHLGFQILPQIAINPETHRRAA